MIKNLLELYDKYGIQYKINEPMSDHTTFRIGGCADVYATPESEELLIRAVQIAREENVRYYVMGRGSNLLFSDDGYRGVVISTLELRNISVCGNTVICGCGASLNSIAVAARDASLEGLAFAYGIPGLVGGAVFMNAGAYGGQISDVLVKSTYFDPATGNIGTFTGAEHKFGYRESVYKENPRLVILCAEFKLENGDRHKITADMEDYMGRRRSKQPLEYPSAGSVFKRPVGHFAGRLIEESGLKGKKIGGATVSEKHAGFIVNAGGATAKDVLELIDFIKSEVRKNYSVELTCEVIFVE